MSKKIYLFALIITMGTLGRVSAQSEDPTHKSCVCWKDEQCTGWVNPIGKCKIHDDCTVVCSSYAGSNNGKKFTGDVMEECKQNSKLPPEEARFLGTYCP